MECWQNQIIYFTCLFFEFNYYIILCIDLMITLKRPFISGKQRFLGYQLSVAVFSVFLLGLTIPEISDYCDQSFKGQPKLYISYYPVVLTELLFYMLGIVSIMMALNNRRKTKDLVDPMVAKAKD